jgi:hypothetical protein
LDLKENIIIVVLHFKKMYYFGVYYSLILSKLVTCDIVENSRSNHATDNNYNWPIINDLTSMIWNWICLQYGIHEIMSTDEQTHQIIIGGDFNEEII